jgi:hypothetical protein
MSRPPYRGRHEATRKVLLADAYGCLCVLCGEPMLPGQALDLDHAPDGSGYRGMAHAKCNRADGGRRGGKRRWQRRRWRMDRIGTCVLAVEVAADRGHSSICSAGRLDDGRVQVELVAYLDGTHTAPDRIVEFCARWTVVGVVVDPMGGATNMRRTLGEHPEIRLFTPDAAAVKVAHADFLDMAKARRLAVVKNDLLSAAMQHLSERQLGGQPVFDRRGTLVDVAPAVAAELAVWGLLNAPKPQPFFAAWR